MKFKFCVEIIDAAAADTEHKVDDDDLNSFEYWDRLIASFYSTFGRMPTWNELTDEQKTFFVQKCIERDSTLDQMQIQREYDEMAGYDLMSELAIDWLMEIMRTQLNTDGHDGFYRIEDLLRLDHRVEPMANGVALIHCLPARHWIAGQNIGGEMQLYDGKWTEERDHAVLQAQMAKMLRPKDGENVIKYTYTLCSHQVEEWECGDLAVARVGDILSKRDISWVVYGASKLLRHHSFAIMMSNEYREYPKYTGDIGKVQWVGGQSVSVELLVCCGMPKHLPRTNWDMSLRPLAQCGMCANMVHRGDGCSDDLGSVFVCKQCKIE